MQIQKEIGTHVRWWLDHDFTYLAQIDRDTFRKEVDGKEDLSEVWTKSKFEQIRAEKGVWGQVAVRNPRLRTNLNVVPGQIVGFIIYRLKDEEVVIERIAVAKSYRGRGIGRRLVAKVKTKLYNRRKKLTVLIRETDERPRRFFTAQDFKASLVGKAFEITAKDEKGQIMVIDHEDGYRMTFEKPKLEGSEINYPEGLSAAG